jgi:hypothetical protein
MPIFLYAELCNNDYDFKDALKNLRANCSADAIEKFHPQLIKIYLINHVVNTCDLGRYKTVDEMLTDQEVSRKYLQRHLNVYFSDWFEEGFDHDRGSCYMILQTGQVIHY